MKKINNILLKKIEMQLKKEARPLEIEYFNCLFKSAPTQAYIQILKTYQNDDGGFGNAIEPDLRLPHSSSMATSVGLRYLLKLNSSPDVDEMTDRAIAYLEETYNSKRLGWYAVDKRVNDYPHSPWWHWDNKKEMTAIDAHWGNSSAELLGYLTVHQSKLKHLLLQPLKDQALNNIESIKSFESFHELYCYAHMIEASETFNHLSSKVSEGIMAMVEQDPSQWYQSYSPAPLNFINDKNRLYGIPMPLINKNLDLLIERFENEGLLTPHWDWNDELYKDNMSSARNEWKGVLTIETLEKLLIFDRIDISR